MYMLCSSGTSVSWLGARKVQPYAVLLAHQAMHRLILQLQKLTMPVNLQIPAASGMKLSIYHILRGDTISLEALIKGIDSTVTSM